MATLEVNEKQLRIIQDALDLYSRIGILQIDRILDHPSIEGMITNRFTPKKELEVGDRTVRGEVVEIGDGYIKTRGSWGNGEEVRTWTDVDDVKLSPDYSKVHETENIIRNICSELKNRIAEDPNIYSANASYGIGRSNEGEHNMIAYDMIQVIRHEYWKVNQYHSSLTVDSYVHQTSPQPLIKVKL